MGLRTAVDNLCLYDPEFQAYANKFTSEMGGSSAVQAVGSMTELQAAIDGYTGVKFLEVCLHGLPGLILFADGVGMRGQNLGTMTQNTLFLQKNARVLFDSCDIGKGAVGRVFMDDLGMLMLKGKGGIIGATTVTNFHLLPKSQFVTSMYLVPLSFGRLIVRNYDENGKRIGQRVVDRHGIERPYEEE
jgi:hypothetical protein